MTPNRATFYLTVVGVNWGRHYDPGEFKRNVLNVMRHTDGQEHVVILPQELDEEPDEAPERKVFNSMLEPHTRKVYFWKSREPIILSPGFKVVRRDRVLVMGSGLDIGGPRGTGPARTLQLCAARYRGVTLGFGNWHPHRKGLHPRVDAAREEGADIASHHLTRVSRWYGGISGAYATDYNERDMPRMVPGERVGHHQGLDHLRYWQHPDGARMERVAHGTLEGTIDPHDPIWARLKVTGR